MKNPRLVVLNGTCLDTIEDHLAWAETQAIEFVADPVNRIMNIEGAVSFSQGAQAVVGPFGGSIPPDFFELVPTLRVLSLASSGFDSVEDPDAATRAGVVVASSPVREGAEVVADYTWGLLLSLVRKIPHHFRALQEGRNERGLSISVYGKTLGILGLGNIGKAVARRASGFDMRVLAYDIDPDLEFVEKHGIRRVELRELLSESDFLSIHLRLNEKTRGFIGKRELALMKPTAYLINSARDELVDESALLAALNHGELAGAATDEAPRHLKAELLNHSNYLCTPHLGNRAREGVFAVTRCALQSAIDVLEGRRPPFVLNPEVYNRGLRSIPTPGVAMR